jgi:uncharacterized LabA/DUF88 family protein
MLSLALLKSNIARLDGIVNPQEEKGSEVPLYRAITYIDGFNLYNGLKAEGWKDCYWLDLRKLSQSLLRPHQQLVFTKYFTARIKGSHARRKRQSTFLDALATLPDFQIYEGVYRKSSITCRHCGAMQPCANCGEPFESYQEKRSDVNLAVEMLTDAFQNRFDMAIVVSGDSDLCPPIEAVRRLFPKKYVYVAFPPQRELDVLKDVATRAVALERSHFEQCQFPDKVQGPNGFVLERPQEWR